jgi:O-antigen/teichoic acid export membrane protein
VFSVLALNFLIIPIAAPVLSVLRRNLEFGKSAIINLSGSTVQNGTAVTMAMLGFGPVSLAWGSFAGIVATITFSTYYRPKEVPWMPGLKDIGRVFSFGTKSSLSTVMNEAGYSAPDLIIGRMLTLGDVGLYSRASGVAALITDQIGMLLHGILFPAFSHENRTGANVKKNFLNRTELFNGLLCPALSFLGFAASPLILLLYGEKWLPAAPIASVICFSALISIPYNLTGSVLMAHGKVGFSAKMSFIVQSLNILSIFAGSLFGLIYIPIFGIVIYIGRFFVSRYAMNKFFGISAREVLAMNVKSFIVSGFALAPLVILRLILPQSTDVHIVIPAYLVSSAIFWLIGIYWTKHLLAQEITIVFESLMKKMAR